MPSVWNASVLLSLEYIIKPILNSLASLYGHTSHIDLDIKQLLDEAEHDIKKLSRPRLMLSTEAEGLDG